MDECSRCHITLFTSIIVEVTCVNSVRVACTEWWAPAATTRELCNESLYMYTWCRGLRSLRPAVINAGAILLMMPVNNASGLALVMGSSPRECWLEVSPSV
jgi:hypothetical protein